MKIEVFDRVRAIDNEEDKKEYGRINLILEGLGSLEQIETTYLVYGKDDFSEKVIELLHQEGVSILPLTYIDNQLVKKEHHLTNAEFIEHTGISFIIEDENELGKNHCHEHGECGCGHHH